MPDWREEKVPLYRRLTLRGYVVLFVVVLGMLCGLAVLATSLTK